MSVCMKNIYFPIKLLKSRIMANVKWRKEPGTEENKFYFT